VVGVGGGRSKDRVTVMQMAAIWMGSWFKPTKVSRVKVARDLAKQITVPRAMEPTMAMGKGP
jgi:hypothetical protein